MGEYAIERVGSLKEWVAGRQVDPLSKRLRAGENGGIGRTAPTLQRKGPDRSRGLNHSSPPQAIPSAEVTMSAAGSGLAEAVQFKGA